jgi:hypothetical protein
MLPNLQLEAHQKQKAALEKENRDLRSALSRLESKLQSKVIFSFSIINVLIKQEE